MWNIRAYLFAEWESRMSFSRQRPEETFNEWIQYAIETLSVISAFNVARSTFTSDAPVWFVRQRNSMRSMGVLLRCGLSSWLVIYSMKSVIHVVTLKPHCIFQSWSVVYSNHHLPPHICIYDRDTPFIRCSDSFNGTRISLPFLHRSDVLQSKTIVNAFYYFHRQQQPSIYLLFDKQYWLMEKDRHISVFAYGIIFGIHISESMCEVCGRRF